MEQMLERSKKGTFMLVDQSGSIVNDILAVCPTDKRTKGGYAIYRTRCTLCGKVDEKPGYHFSRGTARCTCSEWMERHAKRIGRPADPDKSSHVKKLYATYRRSAESRNLVFDLTLEQFRGIIEQDCMYCGASPREKKAGPTSR